MRRGHRHSVIHGVHTIANSQCWLAPDEAIARALAPFGLQPSAALMDAIRAYMELLLRWNRKISLTSITNPEEILQRHFGESMFAASALPMIRGWLLDVGSGAGFPGLAIKIISPELEVTLIEANLKKAAFLGEVVRTLRMTGVKIVTKRIAELKEVKGVADFVTCRAVRPDKSLLAWIYGALVDDGRCVLWLGAKSAAELKEKPGWEWPPPIPVPLSSSRVLLVGKKI